jgi:hypothetical protein
MKTKTMTWFAGCVVGLVATTLSFVSCSQPPAECQTGLYAPYAAVFTPKGAMPACATMPGFAVAKGDLFGAEFYHPPTADGTNYNNDITTMTIQSDTMGNLQLNFSDSMYVDGEPKPFVDGIKGDSPFASGTFVSHLPDANDFCPVTTLTPGQEDFATAGGSKFEDSWNSLQFYVTADAPGTQFVGELTRTDNGCSVTYHVVGMWPAVGCTGADANGGPVADATQCSPCANPDKGMTYGSGINPNFPTACTQLYDVRDPIGRGGACVKLSTNPANCGACGTACTASEVCDAGKCKCAADATMCMPDKDSGLPNFCANLSDDAANCGTCFNACKDKQVCSAGKCTDKCGAGLKACPDVNGNPTACADTNSDTNNCGACGKVCTNGACSQGACTCGTGLQLCGKSDLCTDVSSDPANCGSCDNACGVGQTCSGGICSSEATCPSGLALCGGAPFFCTLTGGDPPQTGAPEPACALATQ